MRIKLAKVIHDIIGNELETDVERLWFTPSQFVPNMRLRELGTNDYCKFVHNFSNLELETNLPVVFNYLN